MSNLHAAVEVLCRRVAERDLDGARTTALQVAATLAPARGSRIRRWFEQDGPKTLHPVRLDRTSTRWETVNEPRSPTVPAAISSAIDAWATEAQYGLELAEAGERVMPLLLCGETRCGKTSLLCAVAARMGLKVNRLSLANVVASHMGESAALLKTALAEAKTSQRALWLIDEVDAISYKRHGGEAASQERALSVGVLLSELEMLPPGLMLAATSNTANLMDVAVLARFNVVEFPRWDDLDEPDREAFAASHGLTNGAGAATSYAEVVTEARRVRVTKVIERAKVAADVDAGGQRELGLATGAA